jgi:hypothetical protein
MKRASDVIARITLALCAAVALSDLGVTVVAFGRKRLENLAQQHDIKLDRALAARRKAVTRTALHNAVIGSAVLLSLAMPKRRFVRLTAATVSFFAVRSLTYGGRMVGTVSFGEPGPSPKAS